MLGYLLLFHVGEFDVRNFAHAGIVAGPAIALSTLMAGRFGRFNGGNTPLAASTNARAD